MHRIPIHGLELKRQRLRFRAGAVALLARHPGPGAVRTLLALEGLLATNKAVARGDRVAWAPLVPLWPSPAFDRWLIAAATDPSYRPLVIVDIEPDNGLEALRAALGGPGAIGVIALRGDALYADEATLLRVVEEASRLSEVWLITSGRRLTASIAERLARAGVQGAAIGFWDASGTAQDKVWGRKSWDDAATAIGLFEQAGILPVMLVELREELVADDGLRRLHRLGGDLGAAFLTLVPGQEDSPMTLAAARSLAEVRNGRPAFTDYPEVSIFGDGGGHWIERLFVSGSARLRPARPNQASSEPEPEPTGMDLPEPAPYRAHPTPAPKGRVTGGVIDALLRRTADLASRK